MKNLKEIRLKIQNTADEIKIAKVLGFVQNYYSENYGSDQGVEISVPDSDKTYGEFLNSFEGELKINDGGFKMKKGFTIRSDNKKQCEQIMQIIVCDAKGSEVVMPIIPQSKKIKKVNGQYEIFIGKKFDIDQYSELTFQVCNKTKLELIIR